MGTIYQAAKILKLFWFSVQNILIKTTSMVKYQTLLLMQIYISAHEQAEQVVSRLLAEHQFITIGYVRRAQPTEKTPNEKSLCLLNDFSQNSQSFMFLTIYFFGYLHIFQLG